MVLCLVNFTTISKVHTWKLISNYRIFPGYSYSHISHAGLQSSVNNKTQSINFESNHNSYYKIQPNSNLTSHNGITGHNNQLLISGVTKQSQVQTINPGKKQVKVENKRSKADKNKSKSSENDNDDVNPCFPECSQSSQNRLFTCPKCSKVSFLSNGLVF